MPIPWDKQSEVLLTMYPNYVLGYLERPCEEVCLDLQVYDFLQILNNQQHKSVTR